MKKQFKKVVTLNMTTDWYDIDKLRKFAEHFNVRYSWIDESKIAFVTLHGVMDEDLFEDFVNSMNLSGMNLWWKDQIVFEV